MTCCICDPRSLLGSGYELKRRLTRVRERGLASGLEREEQNKVLETVLSRGFQTLDFTSRKTVFGRPTQDFNFVFTRSCKLRSHSTLSNVPSFGSGRHDSKLRAYSRGETTPRNSFSLHELERQITNQ